MPGDAWGRRIRIVVGESVVASSAATASAVLLEVPVWAMFVGWIAFFTRGLSLRHGVVNLVCVLMGIALGMGAAYAMAALGPSLDEWAISVVVFAVTVAALSLARVPVFNNLLGFFLGLVAYFAAHQPPSLEIFAELGAAAALGTLAGFLAHALQQRLQRAA